MPPREKEPDHRSACKAADKERTSRRHSDQQAHHGADDEDQTAEVASDVNARDVDGREVGFTRATAKEVIVQGIRVNAVAPGFIDTSRTRAKVGAARQVNVARTPAGRLGTPEEIAATVAFLASEDAAFFVGATVSPNGGLLTAV